MKIIIESEPFSTTEYWSGTIEIDDDGEYDFTIVVGDDFNEITWVNAPPPGDLTLIEQEIIDKFDEMQYICVVKTNI